MGRKMKRNRQKKLTLQSLLFVCLEISKQNKTLVKQNRILARNLHKEIDYSEKLQKKIDNLKQRIKK